MWCLGMVKTWAWQFGIEIFQLILMFVQELIYKEFENEFDKDFFDELTVY